MEKQGSTKKIYDYIIIGGGISGVSFAYQTARSEHSVLILEREPKLGGRIHSIKPKDQPNYWCEMGAHTCYNSYTELISLIRDSGNGDKIVPLGALPYVLYSHKKIKKIFSEILFFEIGFSFWRFFFSEKKGKTTRQYFEPIVGKFNYSKLFSKLFRAVISQEADEYPAEIFLKKRADKDESISRRFSYQGGLSQMVEDIATASGADIITSSHVTKIAKGEDGIFEIETLTGAKHRSLNIAIATDISAAPKLLLDLKMDDAAKLLESIHPSASIAVNVLIEKEKVPLKKIAGIIPLSNEFFSVVSRDTIEDEAWRSFTFHFAESKVSPAERLELIFRVLGIEDEHFSRTEIYRHILPAVRLVDLDLKEKLKNHLQGTSVSILGNYLQGMSLEDCVKHSKEEAG
jgi:protoporphyrinogen/coproporphyrinogen III oxidase